MLTKNEKFMAIFGWAIIVITPVVMYFTVGI